ncbi:class I SAM-dependent methyltransferase [Rhodoferax sp.]|uniref:class I SAM-dependent methyltransferase n=1 Tax=Rhodoferax sp. TaxID=50421 RepID=UPI00262D27D9|nr:class I SAM-dependent methyltransferase [Rhodoferax sp.]MDD5478440.1 class I SAM-dependent methyltransferase [Rhodoferax sp.]
MKNYQGIYQLPLLGKIFRWVHRLATIGRIETELNQRLTELGLAVQHASTCAHQDTAQAAQNTSQAITNLTDQFDRQFESFRGEISHAITSQRNEWKTTLATNSRTLERTTQALLAAQGNTMLAPLASRLTAPDIYLKFEDAFRGRWKVEERVRWYIPHVREIMALGSQKPMLDIGCGRGEWMLELKRNNFTVLGVDLNPNMADAARAQGLEVVLADAVAHLNNLDSGSLSVVSAFHLVEHLPFDQIMVLIEAAFRALMPGGLLILETPNPENLVVGGCTFWYDPTHIRPLPPAMLRFYVAQAGFDPVRTARFYLRTDGPDHATVDVDVLPSIDGPLDYGLLAHKPR